MNKQTKREIYTFLILALLIAAGMSWMNWDRTNSELAGFLHDDPWYWVKPEQAFGYPSLYPHDKPHPRPNDWQFNVVYPAGYSEVIIVPEHRNFCVIQADHERLCKPIEDHRAN
jgi:hypothetical protein